MEKKRTLKVVVNKPGEDIIQSLIADSIAKITKLKINNLPENKRVATLKEILRRLK